jgi:hypothetical protein
MLSNLAETLHSSAKIKNKQVAKIWGLLLKKQRFGATIGVPEGLEDTPWLNACNSLKSFKYEAKWNDRKRKLCESAENGLEKFVKSISGL